MVGVKHILSWSGGKDSTASVILCKEMGEPLDLILFSEVMFDETTSGELPEHIEFIKNVAIPKFNEWGYETKILHYDRTYMDYFNQVRQRGKNIGKKVGFPMADKCNVRNCKVKPIENYIKTLHEEVIQYVGITVDEPLRMERLDKCRKVSLLEKYGYTEDMARKKCEEYGLLSPYYSYSKRGGCFFCPNMCKSQLQYLRKNHKDLWYKLLELEKQDNLAGAYFNTQNKTSLSSLEENFQWEDRQMTIFEFIRRD